MLRYKQAISLASGCIVYVNVALAIAFALVVLVMPCHRKWGGQTNLLRLYNIFAGTVRATKTIERV